MAVKENIGQAREPVSNLTKLDSKRILDFFFVGIPGIPIAGSLGSEGLPDPLRDLAGSQELPARGGDYFFPNAGAASLSMATIIDVAFLFFRNQEAAAMLATDQFPEGEAMTIAVAAIDPAMKDILDPIIEGFFDQGGHYVGMHPLSWRLWHYDLEE
ncbi:MAG: hypothetical protein A3I24_01200 [Candidatus Harrisonbacteria bacterium RIFCSPLOWO2_02_FULL_41_13b]|uniref:Uncharacterized protein n=1 Tax=Candidatus Harrisonbacteria bacterium RIFCSPLOWO2_02_FULL_41_13b TaxID=1798409 RepID=A0A1G1ZRD1_9BACT|nr:MAG: hypothetical protein A3J53_03130 [Candidatus Harrisonbacteria bacterium RIFCSPHIGHO2_02_FULL_40_20]OGY67273.1 MAG: hypothetical protein A3I24_01200 [Candidatus Harrisonbacteria bacterium RIFCSPLOWO2_02_FULL_41_13b]